MKTTPSASPHLSVPATAPPPVPPSEDTTGNDLTQIPAKLLTTELTSNSDLTQSTTPPSPAGAEPPVVTLAKSHITNSGQTSTQSSTQTPPPTQLLVNGRTSGRRRTPKACDCCGPNSIGHNVRTSARGRGRGKGRGRGAGRDLDETPKRKVGSQLTYIKSFDLTKEMVEEAENEDATHKKVQTTQVVAQTESQTLDPLAVTSLQDGSIRNLVAPQKKETQRNEHMCIEQSEVSDLVKKKGGDVELRSCGMAGSRALVSRGRGIAGMGMMGATCASRSFFIGIKRGGGFKINSPAQSVALQEDNKDLEIEHVEQTDSSMVKSPFGNGDTVNLSDTEPEESKEDSLIVSEPDNGLLSISGPPSRSGTPQDLDSEMQVDQIPDEKDQAFLSVTLSNGSFTTQTDHDHISTPMEMDTSRPPTVSPLNQGPITVCKIQHHCALRDHVLYCQPGTWQKEEVEEMLGKDQSEETSEKTQNKESLEQLIDMVHGKMCFEHTAITYNTQKCIHHSHSIRGTLVLR